MLKDVDIQIAGENSLILYFSEQMSPEISQQLLRAQQLIQTQLSHEIIDLVVSYSSILLIFNQAVIDHLQLSQQLKTLLTSQNKLNSQNNHSNNSVIELPVYYAIESGPDLAIISKNTGLTIDEIIKLHSEQHYQVYAIGFAPGFAYLGEVNPQIATARRATPRLKVPKGAVGIADQQTAIYPSLSPGGWNIIGNCPLEMFNPDAESTMPVQVGDTVSFIPISQAEFIALGGQLTPSQLTPSQLTPNQLTPSQLKGSSS